MVRIHHSRCGNLSLFRILNIRTGGDLASDNLSRALASTHVCNMAANPDQEARKRAKATAVVEGDQKHEGKVIYQKEEQNDQSDKTGNYGDLRNTPGSNVDYFAGTQSLLIIVVLLLACIVGFSSRLFAVIRFESIIHEFDPWYVVYNVYVE